MAHIKVYETVMSCPKCGKKLLKVTTGSVLIGSPLIDCKKCGITYKTDLRVEWYKYPTKKIIFVLPALIPIMLLLVGIFMGDPAIGIMAALFGVVFSVCFLAKDLIRIYQSKKRMRNQEYLQRLLMAGMISLDEYTRFSQEAK